MLILSPNPKRNSFLAPSLSLERSCHWDTTIFSRTIEPLFYFLAFLREKAPTEKEGADLNLFFHTHRDNLVKLLNCLSLSPLPTLQAGLSPSQKKCPVH